jgi:hypothetical protein
MIEQLITQSFKARNAAHARHWKTDSFAQHAALGDFYDEIIGSLDKYVEAHQGLFGIVGKLQADVPDITSTLRDDLVWLNENRNEVSHGVPALENIFDELTGIYLKTIYKLEHLR